MSLPQGMTTEMAFVTNGVTTAFALTGLSFELLTDVVVTHTPTGGAAVTLVPSTHYTVSGNKAAGLGVLNSQGAALAAGVLSVTRKTPARQLMTTGQLAQVPIERVEAALDDLGRQNADVRRDVDGAHTRIDDLEQMDIAASVTAAQLAETNAEVAQAGAAASAVTATTQAGIATTLVGNAATTMAGITPGVGPLGTQMANDKGRGIFLGNDALVIPNREELAAWLNALKASQTAALSTGTYNTDIGFILGDSKVGYELDESLDAIARARGFPSADFGGFSASGKNSYYMLNTQLAVMLAHPGWVNTKLVVLNFGTNQQVNGGVDSPARTAAQTDADMRAIIARLRDTGASPAGKSPANLSIIIMGQTAANNPINGQTPELMRELNVIYRKIADDLNCCFFDAFALYTRPHADATWMDDVDAGAPVVPVHPQALFNAMLAHDLADAILPDGFAATYGLGAGSSNSIPADTALPSTYPMGWSSNRVTGGAWPLDGIVLTYRSSSRIASQLIVSRTTAAVQMRAGQGGSDAWTGWVSLGGNAKLNLSPAAGYTLPGSEIARTALGGDAKVLIGGYLNMTVPATIAAGTLLATVAAGHRPIEIQRVVPIAVYDGTLPLIVQNGGVPYTATIALTGDITTNIAITQTVQRVYFQPGASWWQA